MTYFMILSIYHTLHFDRMEFSVKIIGTPDFAEHSTTRKYGGIRGGGVGVEKGSHWRA